MFPVISGTLHGGCGDGGEGGCCCGGAGGFDGGGGVRVVLVQ